MTTDLQKFFENNKGRVIDKWHHYFDIYDAHFSRFRGTDVHVLEVGVSHGGSLQMWKDYFGPKCKIFGVDINPNCKSCEEDGVQIFIGDQEDKTFLKDLSEKIPRIDILIDDGGHTMKQQINTFEILFSKVSDNGVYLCEDLHTSYWRRGFKGGYKRKNSFIEYSKNFIDYINAWHSKTSKLKVSEFTKSASSLHYYDSILVIEKKVRNKPDTSRTGATEIPGFDIGSTRSCFVRFLRHPRKCMFMFFKRMLCL